MTTHYYSSNPQGEHDYRLVDYTFLGKRLEFLTDSEVFAKEHVDYGTSRLIQNMEIKPTDRVLDMGCGYGPIGICAAMLAKQGEVYLVDINERAVALAEANIRRNGVTNARAMVSDVYSQLPEDLRFDVILTNPPIRAGKAVVYQIFEGALERLVPGGAFWVVIQKKQGAPSAKKKLEELFGAVELVERSKGYHVFKAVKSDA